MASFLIEGGRPLRGTITPIGNKNAVIKMIPASLLTNEPVTLTNVPAISDVRIMLDIMKSLGSKIEYNERAGTLTLQTPTIRTSTIPPELGKKLRASNMFLGPLLARKGKVTGVVPGGDRIGPREMTAHFDGFSQLGAIVTAKKGADTFTLSGRLAAADVFLYEPSVTATENVILASVLTPGVTTIENAASEPHVQELCRMLHSMGARIEGIGTNTLVVTGVAELHGTTVAVPPDYIYIGTMVVLSVITGGSLRIEQVNPLDLRSMVYFFRQLGVRLQLKGTTLVVPKQSNLTVKNQEWARTKGVYCQPWPCFPSDMMSLMIVLATQVRGATLFFEKMYPGRMLFAEFLNGLGGTIIVADPHRVIVNGNTPLRSGVLTAPDLRAGMAFVAAGLCATGTTTVHQVEHIDRGYPDIVQVLTKLGAKITRIP